MSIVKKEIQERVLGLKRLTGVNFCSCVSILEKDATDLEYAEAWNNDAHIILGMINDMELLLSKIHLEDYEN